MLIKTDKPSSRHTELQLDFTALNAIATCPTWGLVTYVKRKMLRDSNSEDSWPPLAAGRAFHRATAMMRLYLLYRDGLHDHVVHHGRRVFGTSEFDTIWSTVFGDGNASVDECIYACHTALELSDFIESDSHPRLTRQAIEDAVTLYVNTRYGGNSHLVMPPVWVSDVDDPTAPVGIEIPMYAHDSSTSALIVGRADGIHYHPAKGMIIEDDKTTFRIDDAWEAQARMSHQPANYAELFRAMYDIQINRAYVLGTTLPFSVRGISAITRVRNRLAIDEYYTWLDRQLTTVYEYEGCEQFAPQYTHSCGRYFRPCALIPMCTSTPHERAAMIDRMHDNTWSPLTEPDDE